MARLATRRAAQAPRATTIVTTAKVVFGLIVGEPTGAATTKLPLLEYGAMMESSGGVLHEETAMDGYAAKWGAVVVPMRLVTKPNLKLRREG